MPSREAYAARIAAALDGQYAGSSSEEQLLDRITTAIERGAVVGRSALDATSGKTLYVDSVNGSDSTGARGTTKPFLTPTAAVAVMQVGDTLKIGPGTFLISSPLILLSNTTLICDPDTIIKRTAASVSSGQIGLVGNADESSGNSNIAIFGGTWDGNGSTQTLSNSLTRVQALFRFIKVDRLHISDVIVKDPISLCIQAAQVTKSTFRNIEFQQTITGDIYKDGLHINGPSSDLQISGISGSTNDDFIALNAWDLGPFGPTTGNINRVVISDVNCTSALNVFRMLSAQSCLVSNVTINNVVATAYNTGIIINDFDQGGTRLVSNVSFNNVNIGLVDNAYSEAGVPMMKLGTNITGLRFTNFQRSAADVTVKDMVYFYGTHTYKEISFDGVTINTSQPWSMFWVATGATVDSLSVSNVDVINTAAHASSVYPCGVTNVLGTITALNLRNWNVKGSSDFRLIQAAGTIGTCQISDSNVATCDGLWIEVGVNTVAKLIFDNVALSSGAVATCQMSGSSITQFIMTGCSLDTAVSTMVYFADSGVVSYVNIGNTVVKSVTTGFTIITTTKARIQTNGVRFISVTTPMSLGSAHSLRTLDFPFNKANLVPDLHDVIIDSTLGIQRCSNATGPVWSNN